MAATCPTQSSPRKFYSQTEPYPTLLDGGADAARHNGEQGRNAHTVLCLGALEVLWSRAMFDQQAARMDHRPVNVVERLAQRLARKRKGAERLPRVLGHTLHRSHDAAGGGACGGGGGAERREEVPEPEPAGHRRGHTSAKMLKKQI